MRSLDSPVLKPNLIRFSSARLIGAATAQDDDGAPAVPLWASAAGPEPAESPDVAAVPTPDRSAHVDDATAKLRAIEREIAHAEARLAATQALLETLEREANLACALADDARQQAASIREQARQEGYSAGVQQAEEEQAERVGAIAALAEGAVRARAEFLQRSEPELIELVFEIARKVIGDHLSRDKESLAEIASRALNAAGQADVYYLHLHPTDADIVEQRLRRDALGMSLQIVPDERLSPGDCLVRTAYGRVDARVDAQLHAMREQVVGAA